MDLPIYKLVISSDMSDDSEVDYIALVDRPAIQKNFLAFNERLKFEVISEDKQILSGALMLADVPIYRNNEEFGEHYVVFDAETIQQIAEKFFKRGYQSNVNEMHDANKAVQGVTMFESWLVNHEMGKMPIKGFEDAKDGSWFGSYKVDNAEVWAKVKSGEFQGFSVEGIFGYSDIVKKEDDAMIEKIKEILRSAGI
jgi:hypothetical protein